MLSDAMVFPTVAVSDIETAKDFYGNKLGLKIEEETPNGITYKCHQSNLFIYQSPTAGTGQATCAAWRVDDIAGTVHALRAGGVVFEEYDIPGAEADSDSIYTMGQQQAAWFKDPDGNILGLTS